MADEQWPGTPVQTEQQWPGTETKAAASERGVGQRMLEAAKETFESGVGAAKKFYSDPRNILKLARPAEMLMPGMPQHVPTDWQGIKRAGKEIIGPPLERATGAAGPLTATVGAATSGLVASPLASALGAAHRKEMELTGQPVPTSEEAYRGMLPKTEILASMLPIGGKYAKAAHLAEAAGPEAEAGRIITKAATDPAAVERALAFPSHHEIVPGSRPTTYQLTNDPGLGQLEHLYRSARDVQGFRQRAAEQNQARLEELEQAAGRGSPQAVADSLRGAMESDRAIAESNFNTAQQLAQDASRQVGGTYDATTYGNVLRRELMQAEETARANEREIWRRVNPEGTLVADPQAVQQVERSIYSPARMTETARAGVTPAEAQLSNLIQNYGRMIPFGELTDLRSLTSAAMRHERLTNGQSPALARLSQLRQGIEDALVTSVADVTPTGISQGAAAAGAAERVREASAATRQRAETFGGKPIRDITRREGAAGPFRMGEAAVPGAIVKPGPQGYDTASAYFRAVGNERGLPDITDALAADMRRAGVISPEGMADPRKLQAWMRQREGVLRAITERDGGAFMQRLTNVERSARGVAEAEAAAGQVRDVHEATTELRRLTGDVAGDEHVANIFGNIFGKVDSPQRARELAARLRTPQDREGARRAIFDYIDRKLLSNRPAGDIRAEQFQNFVRGNRGALGAFLSQDQIAALDRIAADIRRANRSMETKARGSSDTAQLLQAKEMLKQSILERVGVTLLPHLAGQIPIAGTPLKWAASHLLPEVVQGRRSKLVEHIQKLVGEGMLTPERAAELMRAAKPRQVGARPSIPQTVYVSGRPGAIGASQSLQERDQQKSVSRAAGGALPPRGDERVRSPGTTTPAGFGTARPRTGQALQDGGAARLRQADGATQGPIGRFPIGGIHQGTGFRGAGPFAQRLAGDRSDQPPPKMPMPPAEGDIAKLLKGYGISAGSGFKETPGLAEGGDVMSDVDERPVAGEQYAGMASKLLKPLIGLPQKPVAVGGRMITPGPSEPIRGAAESYVRGSGLPHVPLQNYVPVDPERARAIAGAFEAMPHAPHDPAVRASYEALANETKAQYESLRNLGFKFEPMPAGHDPYAATPRLAIRDLNENKHMYYFPSEVGFGSGQMSAADLMANPMMKGSGIKIGGKEVPYNDLFRIVHDVYGHAKEGVGFRAAGEENAWRSHSRMYSPEALPAMTAETRGQNSWVNYGPHGTQNRAASAAGTIYAPQKTGMLPRWVVDVGRLSPLGVAGLGALPEPQRRQEGGDVEGEAQQAGLAREVAAERTRRGVRPENQPWYMGRRQEGELAPALSKALVPQTPLDIAMYALGGPFSRAAKVGALAAGSMLTSDEAQAGPASAARKAVPELLRIGRRAPEGAVYPGIYKRPEAIAREAEAMVAPEHPALKELFGVTRDDLYGISQQGRRPGNITPTLASAENPKGSYVAEGVMTPANEKRILAALEAAEKYAPRLVRGMDPWYVMDPAFQRLVKLVGPEQAILDYRRLNTLTSMASPASDVMTEINRGTAANMMAQRGEFPLFQRYAGLAEAKRGADFPSSLRDVIGHPYHSTAQAGPMANYLRSGAIEMGSPKVPLYIPASGVPETGFQTILPVPDAHFTRAIGASDVRAAHGHQNPGVSMKMSEYNQVGPWWRERIAQPTGIQAVPAQARAWGLFSPQTGVDTPIGAPKLELLAQKIWERAQRLGVDPKWLRDQVLMGKEHARLQAPAQSAVG